MRLKWYGHASFLVEADNGTRIITDPYTPELIGYSPIRDSAHVVIVSSPEDPAHGRADLIAGDPVVIDAFALARISGTTLQHGITFHAIDTVDERTVLNNDASPHGMYRFAVDGIHVGHLGDLNNPMTARHIEFFRGVDMLLALAGGYPAIELDDLKRAIDKIAPRLVVPMHFRTLSYKRHEFYWLDAFLDYFDHADVDWALHYEVLIRPENLPQQTRVLVMNHANSRDTAVEYIPGNMG